MGEKKVKVSILAVASLPLQRLRELWNSCEILLHMYRMS